MANVFTPLSNEHYAVPRAQAAFRKHGTEKFVNLGDVESFTLTPNITEIERYSKEYSTRTLARSDVVQKDVTIGMTLLHMTPLIKSILYMADDESVAVQSAISAGSATFAHVEAGDIYSLDAMDVTITEVTAGSTTLTSPADYKVDRRTGFIEFLKDATGAVTVEFTAPEIASAAKRASFGLMQTNGVRGELFLRGVGDIGAQHEVRIWDVELRPSGDIEEQGGDDYQQVQITGRVYADGTQAPGFEYGRLRAIPRTALA